MASPKWEWLGGKEPPPALSSPTAAAALDLDRRGEFSPPPRTIAPRLSGAGSTAADLLFAALDADGNGVITKDEMRDGLAGTRTSPISSRTSPGSRDAISPTLGMVLPGDGTRDGTTGSPSPRDRAAAALHHGTGGHAVHLGQELQQARLELSKHKSEAERLDVLLRHTKEDGVRKERGRQGVAQAQIERLEGQSKAYRAEAEAASASLHEVEAQLQEQVRLTLPVAPPRPTPAPRDHEGLGRCRRRGGRRREPSPARTRSPSPRCARPNAAPNSRASVPSPR